MRKESTRSDKDDIHVSLPLQSGKAQIPDAERRAWFLLFSAVAVQFYGGSLYTRGVFVLSRIWQGKAVLAAVILPWLLVLTFGYEYCRRDPDGKPLPMRQLPLLLACNTSACLLSGVGVLAGGTVAGMCGLWSVLRTRKLTAAAPYLLACIPVILYGGIYGLVK